MLSSAKGGTGTLSRYSTCYIWIARLRGTAVWHLRSVGVSCIYYTRHYMDYVEYTHVTCEFDQFRAKFLLSSS